LLISKASVLTRDQSSSASASAALGFAEGGCVGLESVSDDVVVVRGLA
jgi:hypothetical protein